MNKTPDPRKAYATDPAGMEAEFMTFLDREKARSKFRAYHIQAKLTTVYSLQRSLA